MKLREYLETEAIAARRLDTALELKRKLEAAEAVIADQQAVIEAARKVKESFYSTAEFLMLDNSPCWCGRTEGHTYTCKKMRGEFAELAAKLTKLDGTK